jgi:hypothetical protein
MFNRLTNLQKKNVRNEIHMVNLNRENIFRLCLAVLKKTLSLQSQFETGVKYSCGCGEIGRRTRLRI